MDKSEADGNVFDDLDAFFNAAGSDNPLDIEAAAANVSSRELPPPGPAAAGSQPKPEMRKKKKPGKSSRRRNTRAGAASSGLKGKFIAVDAGADAKDPFVLIPAHITSYIPWWGWAAIGFGLLLLIGGVILMPAWSLSSLASRLGDTDDLTARNAMRSLVMNGDARTVNKLYDMASSGGEGLTARLRAVDAMSLINVPETDRSLLRLELAGGTNEQVREAAIAARKQREAARTRGRR